jgi:hypothetical protein
MRHYWCCPAELTEQQVHDYLLDRHRQRDTDPLWGIRILSPLAYPKSARDTLADKH